MALTDKERWNIFLKDLSLGYLKLYNKWSHDDIIWPLYNHYINLKIINCNNNCLINGCYNRLLHCESCFEELTVNDWIFLDISKLPCHSNLNK